MSRVPMVNRGAEQLRKGARSARARGREISRCARLDVPWARCRPARSAREGFQRLVLSPLVTFYMRRRTVGREHFDDLEPPVLFVANHASHVDTPIILRALPARWRQRTVVAAAADYFYRNRIVASIVSLLFNTVPIERGGGLDKGAVEHLDRLIDARWNLLLYPEGTRSRDGGVGRFRAGAAMLAAEHGIAIVPIHIAGTREAMPPGRLWAKRRPGPLWPRRHDITVTIGAPIRPAPGESHRRVTERVREFFAERTGETAPATRRDGEREMSPPAPAPVPATAAPAADAPAPVGASPAASAQH